MDPQPPFLGVERSITGRRWTGPGPAIERAGLAMVQATGLPEIVARLLAARGVDPGEADRYLTPTLRDLMPDPSSLADMDEAAARLAGAVARGERIAIFGDYDVDGAASVTLLLDWLRALGREATAYVPDRIEEGYGPSEPVMHKLGGTHDLVVCVDCGTLGHGPVAAARAAGADVMIVDHHLPGDTLPDALVVNPNRADDNAGLGHLCAAGVVFLLLVATNRHLRGERFFSDGRREPDLIATLDLVALATVADVAPLIGLNRAFVRQGLSVLARRARPGLVALADVAGLRAPPTSRDLGFALGPRINAGGRVGSSDLGWRLLAASDPHEAAALAEKLETLNRERRNIETAVFEAAARQIEERESDGILVWAAGQGWHPGVVGIVASRLKERFARPAVVIGIDAGEGKGSGRSVEGIDLGTAVTCLAADGLLSKGGGHRMAAGLTVNAERIEPAMAALDRLLAKQGLDLGGPRDLVLDGAVSPAGATIELVEQLEAAGPFGPSNPAPRIALPSVVPTGVRIVGNGHCQLRLAGAHGPALAAIAFRAADGDLGEALTAAASAHRPLHIAGRIELDDWGGRRKPKLLIDDAALP